MKINLPKITRELEELRNANAEIDSYIRVVEKLITGGFLSYGSISKTGVELYRATNHHTSVPKNIKELWYPPIENARLSRANREGSPIFYATSDPNCSFLELGIQKDQLCVLSKWMNTDDMILHDIGYINDVFQRAKSKRKVSINNSEFKKINEISKYIHLAFTEFDNPNYNLTCAIAEVYLRSDIMSGLRYPAIKKDGNVDNVALIPDFVNKSLKLVSAELVKVDEINKDHPIEGEVIADFINIDDEGNINWNYRKQGERIGPGKSFQLKIGKNFIQTSGEYRIEEISFKVEPGYSLENINNKKVIIRNLKDEEIDTIHIDCENSKIDSPIKELLKYDFLYAIETNEKIRNCDSKSVSFRILIKFKMDGDKWIAEILELPAFKFQNTKANSQLVGLKKLIEDIQKSPDYNLEHKFGIILDLEKSNLKELNKRDNPHSEGFCLPKNFELIQSSIIDEEDSPHNQFIEYCKNKLNIVLEQV